MDVLSIFFYLHAATQYTDNTDLKTNYKKKYTDKQNMKSLYSHWNPFYIIYYITITALNCI